MYRLNEYKQDLGQSQQQQILDIYPLIITIKLKNYRDNVIMIDILNKSINDYLNLNLYGFEYTQIL